MSSLKLTVWLVLLQDIPSLDPAAQDEEEVCETVGATSGRSISSPLATEDFVPEEAQEQTAAVENQP
jgi:hypothetical protein